MKFKNVVVSDFDLTDEVESEFVVPYGEGVLSLRGNTGEIEVDCYDDFVKQCKKPLSFSIGRMRCDFIINSTLSDKHRNSIILAELTSSGSKRNLSKPITDGNNRFEGGKYKKAEKQLAESLKTLCDVPAIKSYIDGKDNKVCLMAYKIKEKSDSNKYALRPAKKYLRVETEEAINGAELDSPDINKFGFIYRRISHKTYFQL